MMGGWDGICFFLFFFFWALSFEIIKFQPLIEAYSSVLSYNSLR